MEMVYRCPKCWNWVKETLDQCPFCRRPLNPKSITWEKFGTWVDAEGYIGATIRRPFRLWARFEVYQSNEARGGLEVLHNLKDFVEKELGFQGVITERAIPTQYVLFYNKAMEVYELCHAVLPHLSLKLRIQQAREAMKTIEDFTRTQHKRMVTLIQEGKDLVIWKHLREYEEWLRRIEEIKRRYKLLGKGRGF